MRVLLALISALALAPSARAQSPARAELSYVTARTPIITHVLGTRSNPSTAPVSAYLAALDATLRTRTDLTVRSIEQSGIDASAFEACAAEIRMTCWSRAALGTSAYLLILAVQPEQTSAALTAILIDLDEAAKILTATTAPENTDHTERAEDLLFTSALRTEPVRLRPEHDTELAAYFRALVENDLRARLETKNHWRPHGTLELQLRGPAARLDLDGLPLSAPAEKTQLTIKDIPAGHHQLIVRWPDGTAETHTFELSAATPTIHLSTGTGTPDHQNAKRALFWTGLGVGLSGVTLAVAAAVTAGEENVRGACLLRPGVAENSCPGLGTPTFNRAPERAPSTSPSEMNPPGLAFAPLGAALIGAGLTWAAGTMLFDRESDDLWLIFASGLIAGGLAYGTGALLDAR